MKSLRPFHIWLNEGSYSNSSGEKFWGDKGAGILPFCKSTGRFLIAKRSDDVNEPGTWGTWGGKMEQGENPKETAKREMTEECGYNGNITLISLTLFKTNSGSFEFHNFLGVVDSEFEPEIDPYEVSTFRWVSFKELKELENKHFGIDHILTNDIEILNRWTKLTK